MNVCVFLCMSATVAAKMDKASTHESAVTHAGTVFVTPYLDL